MHALWDVVLKHFESSVGRHVEDSDIIKPDLFMDRVYHQVTDTTCTHPNERRKRMQNQGQFCDQ